ncbi:PH domain-containing protein [Anaerobium acetethylicum]|uniref:PH domain-containing protein n=1 Tax=Anaerobium acetethylicum TaxID=1619234 RepID=A0A1D3TS52_9FIRM|nr:PH domain-containing protein [Anaerobium acetethylicum]SCP96603.1 PH domain-containing protein [Anaerobium acetethylicum]
MEFVERKRLLFLGLPWTFTKYTVSEDLLTINAGLLRTTENDCFMYKIQDVTLSATILERIFGLGTLTCFTGDTTNPELVMLHIKHARDIKNFILQASEEARRKRRTINTLDIGSEDVDNLN